MPKRNRTKPKKEILDVFRRLFWCCGSSISGISHNKRQLPHFWMYLQLCIHTSTQSQVSAHTSKIQRYAIRIYRYKMFPLRSTPPILPPTFWQHFGNTALQSKNKSLFFSHASRFCGRAESPKLTLLSNTVCVCVCVVSLTLDWP